MLTNIKTLSTVIARCVLLSCCSGAEPEPGSASPGQTVETEQDSGSNPVSPLKKVCDKAFALMEKYEPGTVPRNKVVALANDAFFIDDSVPVTEAFSNLNNVYVFDDGTSSEQEVRSQLTQVCG